MRHCLVVPIVAAIPAALVGAPMASAADEHCANQTPLTVPGAQRQLTACLDDLTTAGTTLTGHTDQTDWNGLHASGTQNPTGVPGIQVDGYFPDTSTTNGTRGWFHDAQFVIRLPDDWNGKLVVTGAPGVRKQYANDFIISDWVLDRGYAFASTDKGNTGTGFYRDGATPAAAVLEWHQRVTELTRAAKQLIAQRYGHEPARTYMTGISNGGYLTRWQLEHHPKLFDGGVDWEGTLFLADGPNLFTYLPAALTHLPAYAATGSTAAHDAMVSAGFEPGSEYLWDYHYAVYWDLTQRIYREEFDPGYDGALEAGIPFCRPGTPACDADYDYFGRPRYVRAAVDEVSLSGRIGKPMLTLHGTHDALLPIRTDSDVYAGLVDNAGRGTKHRYYRIEAGNHVDGLYDEHPGKLRPILPCYRSAFVALERWVEGTTKPPASATYPRPADGDLVNTCPLGLTGRQPASRPHLRATMAATTRSS